MKDKFQYNAQLFIETIQRTAGVTLAYDEASVGWLDRYIERRRTRLAIGADHAMVNLVGSFLGECIRNQFGGEWIELPLGWGVCFDYQNCVFPINKVKKQFELGVDESILSFYRTIPILFALDSHTD